MYDLRRVLLASTAVILCGWFTGHCHAEDLNHFTHGPILGRLSDHGVGIWARTYREGSFEVRYGSSLNTLTQRTPPIPTDVTNDNTGWILLTGLDANTKYHYELFITGSDSPSGRRGSFRTLPNSAELVDTELNPRGLFNFSFEYAWK